MSAVSLSYVKSIASQYRGRINNIYLHWTAGNYNQVFGDYHFCVTGEGGIEMMHQNLDAVLAHTWHRNTGNIGIALCCCYDAQIWADGRFDLGSMPPTDVQIEATARLIATLANELGIPVIKDRIMTHAEVADIDGYGPAYMGTSAFEKWDLWKLKDYDGVWKNGGDVLRGKAIWFQHHPC